jgi:hypothetical protein
MANTPPKRSQKVQIILNDSLNQKLNLAARRSGVTKSAFVQVALKRELALDRQLDRQLASNARPQKQEERENKYQLELF